MHQSPAFLEGGGEMGALMRAHDWTATPLGSPAEWPQSLKSALSICLHSPIVCGLYWGSDFRMLYNDAYAIALAEKHPHALGLPLKHVWSEIWDVLGPQMNVVIQTGQGFAVENQPLKMKRHGRIEETFWIYSFTPIRGESEDHVGIFVTAIDNTEKVLADRRNAVEREQMWAISQDLLVVARLDGTLTTVNSAWTELLGWNETELVGRSFVEFAHPDDLDATIRAFKSIAETPLVVPYEYRLRHKDGSYRWFSWTGAVSHKLVYANGRHTTLTKEQAATILSERTDAQLREQFIAVLGHDLRNPLASLGGGTKILSRLPQVDKANTVLQMMDASVRRMDRLIEDMLDLARGRLGDGFLLEKNYSLLEPTFIQVIDEIKTAHPDRTIEKRLNLEHPFHCDHGRLAQLFSNLLGNAVTHGAIDKPIRIEATNDVNGLKLVVANGGKPIPPEAMERLFQPFHRGEVRSSLQGLGLGLFIASEIARAHNGKLEVTSSLDETLFTFTAPSQQFRVP
jgi:sigma-B regulation protein RsbU (phosphoserine phosphatase)